MAMEVPEALALVREHVGLTYRLYGAGRVDDALTAITAAREQLHQVARAHAAVHAWPDASYFDLACEVCFTFGYLLLHTGRQDEAIGLYEEGHTAAFEGGLELREAEALGYLAPLMAGAGEHATAGEMLQRAATIVDQADVKPEVAAEPHINLAD